MRIYQARYKNQLSFRLANGIFWSVFGALVSRAILLVTAVALGRILGSSGFGELGIIQSTMGLFGLSIGAVLTLTITKHIAEFRNINPDQIGDTISLFLRIGSIFGLLAIATAIVLSPWLALNILGQASLTVGLQISSILILSGILFSIQNGVLAGLEDFRLMTITLAIRAVLALVFQIVGTLKFGLIGAVIGLVLAEGIAVIGVHWMVIRLLESKGISFSLKTVNMSSLRLLSSFTLPIFISSIVFQFASWLNNVILVNQTEGFQSLGIFNAADKYRQILLFIPSSISVAILPILSNLWGTNNKTDYRRAFTTNLVTNLIFVLIPCIFLILISRQAMSVYGLEYKSGWMTLVILTMSAVVIMLNTILGQVLISANMIWRRSVLDILLAFGLVALGQLFIPKIRENGLALAQLISYGFVSLLLFFLTYRYISKGNKIVANE